MGRLGQNFQREQIMEAIQGCGGITLTVATRLGCAWHTAEYYIKKWVSTKQAFDAEDEKTLDRAESLVKRNIDLGLKIQQDTKKPVDSGDAKWILSRKGKSRGYAPKSEHEIGGAIEINDPRTKYHDRALATLADALGGLLVERREEQSGAVDAAERAAVESSA